MKNCYQAQLVILLTIFSFVGLFAQRNLNVNPLDHPYCATVEMEKRLQAQYGIEDRTQHFEKWLRPKIAEYKEQAARSTSEEVFTIPVVIHVIHNGDKVGVDENISDEQILSQLTVLNEDFRNVVGTPGESTNPNGTDVGIEFCLAQRNPDGGVSTAINRYDLGQESYTRAEVEANIKSFTQWDPDQFLNIWIVKFGGADASLGGFAQFPSAASLAGLFADEGEGETDGITINYQTFGTNAGGATYDLLTNFEGGRVTTHEVGHWLGLRHIWGDGDCTFDDYCSDTPISGGSNTTCIGTEDTCPGGSADMTENYMDYTYDSCKNTFTVEQKARMRSVILNAKRRANLLKSSACLPPVATVSLETELFEVVESTNCNDTEITFNVVLSEASEKDVTIKFIPGGSATELVDYTFSPSSVKYKPGAFGTKTVTVSIINDAVFEGDETITLDLKLITEGDAVLTKSDKKSLTINIEEDETAAAATRELVIYSENFEAGLGDFSTTGNTGSDKFQVASPGEGSGYFYLIQNTNNTKVAYTNDDECNCDKDDDRLISQDFSLENLESAVLQFDHAFANNFDFAEVLISVNSGTSWAPIQTITNTSDDKGDGIISSPWNTVTVDLAAYVGTATVAVAFRYSDQMDWAYGMAIDNIIVKGTEKMPVQASINDSAPVEFDFGPNANVNIYDPTSGNLMASLQNLTDWDYGCTTISVDNDSDMQGAAVKNLWSEKDEDKISAKTFYIQPVNNNPTGAYKITWFYTKEEIESWSGITGHGLEELQMIKVKESSLNIVKPDNWELFTIENIAASLEPFGDDYAISATFNSGFSGFGVGNYSSAPLAAELTNFDAKQNILGQAALNWKTTSETNIDSYEVERSFSGIEFEKIGALDGKNNLLNNDYNFTDVNPLTGENYYRLKIVSTDGTYTYSEIKLLTFKTLENDQVITFPNPTNSQVEIKWTAPQNGTVIMEILSLADGKRVGQESWGVSKGQQTNAISLEQFTAGIYLIKINGTGFQKYTRIIKR